MNNTRKNNAPYKYLISKGVDGFFASIYDVTLFVFRFFKELFSPPFEFKEFIRQCYVIGVKSISLITLTGLITGIVFTTQFRPVLMEFGAEGWVPSLVAIAVVRALAPLVTAIICAGRIGSSIGAELAAMRVTDQIDAMEVSAVNPFNYLIVSRVLATTFMIPALTIYFGVMCFAGTFIDVSQNDQLSIVSFVSGTFERLSFFDLGSSMTRAIIFGFTLGMVGCYQGYNAGQGTEGVGRAANRAVVVTMFLLFIEEILIVSTIKIINAA